MANSEMYYNEYFRESWKDMTEEEKNCMKISIPVEWIQRWVNDEYRLSCMEYHMAIELMRKNKDIKRLLSNGF